MTIQMKILIYNIKEIINRTIKLCSKSKTAKIGMSVTHRLIYSCIFTEMKIVSVNYFEDILKLYVCVWHI